MWECSITDMTYRNLPLPIVFISIWQEKQGLIYNLKHANNTSDILTVLCSLGKIDADKGSYPTINRYFELINPDCVEEIIRDISLNSIIINGYKVRPEIFMSCLLNREMYEIATNCIKYCDKALLKFYPGYLNEKCLDLLYYKTTDEYNKAFRLCMWLLRNEIFSLEEFNPRVRQILDVWS